MDKIQWTKYNGQNIQRTKYTTDKIYNGQNIQWTKYNGQNIIDKI